MTITLQDRFDASALLDSAFEDETHIHDEVNSDGIIDWLQSQSVPFETWLNISSRDTLRNSLQQGVASAIEKHALTPSAIPHVRDNIYDLRRAAWQVLCPLHRNSIVIDFGCGLGALSRSMARNVGCVIGIDACYERLMINTAVNNEQGIENVNCIFGNHQTLSKIRDASIDGLILNGVLEWLPEYIPGHPSQVQVDFLRECHRILKPGGWLYLGIENRWGFRYFLGKPDEHTELHFSNLLPRWLATTYSRICRRMPYRTYTYGAAALRSILTRAGLSESDFFVPLADYRGFEALVPLNDRPAPEAVVAKRLGVNKPWKRRIIESRAFFRRFAPCFSVIGSKGPTVAPSWLSDITKLPSRIINVYVKYDQASIWYRAEDREIRVREFPLSTDAANKLHRIADLASELQESNACPTVLRDWTLTSADGYTWADRKLISGTPLDHADANVKDSYLEELFRELRQTHCLAKSLTWNALSMNDLFSEYAPNAARDLPASMLSSVRTLIDRIERTTKRSRILMHGDAQASNVVISNGKAHLIDWEWSRVVENIGYDVLKFAWSDREDLTNIDAQDSSDAVERSLDDLTARQYFNEVHPDGDWKSSVLVYWVNRLTRTIGASQYGAMSTEWFERVLTPWIESMDRISKT